MCNPQPNKCSQQWQSCKDDLEYCSVQSTHKTLRMVWVPHSFRDEWPLKSLNQKRKTLNPKRKKRKKKKPFNCQRKQSEIWKHTYRVWNAHIQKGDETTYLARSLNSVFTIKIELLVCFLTLLLIDYKLFFRVLITFCNDNCLLLYHICTHFSKTVEVCCNKSVGDRIHHWVCWNHGQTMWGKKWGAIGNVLGNILGTWWNILGTD